MKQSRLLMLAQTIAMMSLLSLCAQIVAVPVGPTPPQDRAKVRNDVGPSFPQLSIPPLHFAVVVFDPQIDENSRSLEDDGVWPEVRKTESMRSAHRVKEAIERLNQFDSVAVAPSTQVSADLYLRGHIERSTSEIMRIRWNLIDARGVTWVPSKSSDHRVELGWHKRFYTPGKDAFQPLWNEIANDVHAALKKRAAKHVSITRKNSSRIRRGKAPRLSELDQIAETRDLVLARFFAPELYGDTLRLTNKNQWQISYIPDKKTEEWLRVQAFAKKDQDLANVYDVQYGMFFESANPVYEKWLNDVYPYAREMRLEKRRYRIEQTVGGLVLLATAAAAAGAGSAEASSEALKVGAALGGGLLIKSLFDRADFKDNSAKFDELSKNYHDSFQPMNLVVQGETVTLQGKADSQFTQWRAFLHDFYRQEQADTYAIEIIQ